MKISKREIAVYLAEVKNAIQNDQYRIERNVHRQDNIDLFLAYIIDERKAKEILLDLTVEDFSEIRQNTHKGYEHEQLYVFGKDIELLERIGNTKKTVSLYIKFNKKSLLIEYYVFFTNSLFFNIYSNIYKNPCCQVS